ncbi:transcriptional regulator [Paenibacillus sp. CAA11]|uniref:ArsR/SmtB family transcription factor n=1 Tax=Paenibacillus sp. CAA11 TaxID=1532905 RepID=UPI000D35D13A|nr:helix-turn-helix domain-containing protein [Paenibacillus sp. CAA11]AWB43395.1 transcriptional regulator [Paenibacillus sp. CAA11]
MTDVLNFKTPEEIKIYSDPYRLKIFNNFHLIGRPATVKEVADTMGEVPAKVYYHVKKLESIGLLKVVETREIKGIIAKYYQPFHGEIQIVNKELEPAVKKLYTSATQGLISEMFEMNKQHFLSNIGGDNPAAGQLMNKKLRMSPEEAQEFFKEVQGLAEKYENRNAEPGLKSYELFVSMMMGCSPKSTDHE